MKSVTEQYPHSDSYVFSVILGDIDLEIFSTNLKLQVQNFSGTSYKISRKKIKNNEGHVYID